MAAVAKQTAAMVGGAAGNLTVPDLPLPTSQLTPNFFDSIFNDGMNPFDECFGGSTPGGSSLLASTLRKENSIYNSTPSDRPKVLLKDETLPAISTRVDRALTPEQSPKTLSSSAQASLPTELSLSRSPSPFTFSIQTTFPQSPVSSITPITSPEDMTPTDPAIKEQVTPPMAPQIQKVTRKSFSALKANNATPIHKRNQSLPQNWNLGNQFIPELPDGKSTPLRKAQNALPKGLECVPKPALRSKTRFSDTPLPQLVSRMDGIFVTENIPLSEVKAEPDSPNAATFHSINSAGRKRKKSSITDFDDDDEEEDEDDSKLNETEKRARFLERNRIAASKCRKKKKLMNQRLEDKSRLLVQQNRFLSASLAKLRSDVLRLKQMVLTHHACGHAPIEQYLHNEAGKYLAAESEDNAKRLKKDSKVNPKSTDLDGMLKAEDVKLPAWLNEFHSFQEVESEALKRSGNILDFDDDDFQKLLLGDQITMLDDEFGTSPPIYE